MGIADIFAYKRLFTHLAQLCTVSESMWEYICDNSTFQSFSKDELLLAEDRECAHIYFIARGFCSCFYQKDGKECVMQFAREGDFCASYHSFLSKNKSFLSIKATEHTDVICIHRDHFEQLWKDYPEFITLFCRILESHVVSIEDRIYRMRSNQAGDRVKHYLRTKEIQNLKKHVPQYSIASYLNMTPETFAKIFGDLSRGEK